MNAQETMNKIDFLLRILDNDVLEISEEETQRIVNRIMVLIHLL